MSLSKITIPSVIAQIIATLSLCSEVSAAEEPPYLQCFKEAGQRYSVEPSVLIALGDTESGFDPKAINQRTPSDKDIGLMQIWSNWLPKLSEFNIGEKELLEPCININIGAWILSQNFASHGLNLRALGAYNAGFSEKNEPRRQKYLAKVLPRILYYRKMLDGAQ